MQFNYASVLPYPVDQVFRYHEQAGAINRLIPPWEPAAVLSSNDSLSVGSIVQVQNKIGPITQTWVAEHTEYRPGELFVDQLRSGPFARWKHSHRFEALSPTTSRLTESIDYQLHGAPLSSFLKPWVEGKLQSMFRFRHRITADDLSFLQHLQQIGQNPATRKIKIGISGSSGLIGRRTIELARVLGIEVVRSERNQSSENSQRWPRGVESYKEDQLEKFEELDAWIHLGGVGIADRRWSTQYKNAIRSTRVESTRRLVERLARLDRPPKALVCASGVGIYGNRGAELLDESSKVDPSVTGDDFLADVAREWESAASAYQDHGGRTALARFGVVLHPRGGALSKMLGPFRLGLGGRMGTGKQFWPWVHIDDAASILIHLSLNPTCNGPFNVVAPECPSNLEFSQTLAQVLKRPCWTPAPAFALRLALGEMADSLLMASTRCAPASLISSGYRFRFPTLQGALQNLLGAEPVRDK